MNLVAYSKKYNKGKPLVTFIFGTRPEAIKLAPVIKQFQACDLIDTRIINTGQHRDLVLDVLNLFKIEVDINLDVMSKIPSLTNLTCKILEKLDTEFDNYSPSLVLVQGDTTTAYASALASFYKKIPIAHVEAGLRTNNIYSPFPEEVNRRLISQIANIHFSPTKRAEENLIAANTSGKIVTTGNTVIDALIFISNNKNDYLRNLPVRKKDKLILATIHRRENWGDNLIQICKGILKILHIHEDVFFLIPLHPNKIVKEPIKELLGKHKRVKLVNSLDYSSLVSVLKECKFVITDSGGLQEEAPTFDKPVLIIRKETERIEGIAAGTAKVIGIKAEDIYKEANELLTNSKIYEKMSQAENPFGEGNSSNLILEVCLKELGY